MQPFQLNNDQLYLEIENILREGKTVRCTPNGRSMRPFIRGGKDEVVLRQKPSLQVGDIVLAHIGENYILHRLIRIEGEQLILMGDGNLEQTESCTRSEVLATVVDIYDEKGKKKKLTRGHLWSALRPMRPCLLKAYRYWIRHIKKEEL